MEQSTETLAISSDDAQWSWEQALVEEVSAAISRRPSATDPAEEFNLTADATSAVSESSPKEKRASDILETEKKYLAEILVDHKTTANEMFQICRSLTTELKSEILSVNYSREGTTIECTVSNPSSFLKSLDMLCGDFSWSLVTEEGPEEQESTVEDESYVGALFVDAGVGPTGTFKVCRELMTRLKSEIISVDYSDHGTTINCTVLNPAVLLGFLPDLSGISAWTLVPQGPQEHRLDLSLAGAY